MNSNADIPPPLEYTAPQAPVSAGPPPKQGRSGGGGCLAGCGTGCLISIIVLVLIVGGLVWMGYKAVSRAVDEYTSEQPIVFVEPEADPQTIQSLVSQFDVFRTALAQGKEAPPLTLTGRDINLLMYHHPDWAPLAGKANVDIVEDRMTAKVSVPLHEIFPIALVKGRYLNGEATMRLGLSEGVIAAYFDDLKIGDNPLPGEVMDQIRNENLFKDANSDPEFRKILSSLAEIRIESGRLILMPKSAAERIQSAIPVPTQPTPAEAIPPTPNRPLAPDRQPAPPVTPPLPVPPR
ncbi:MAG: hypothetical protein H7A53_08720 [Akkermansiaceae bacterium]|nr:hypothetical protein [Akkermansiaceae bacterium]MCP5550960.1 hypothetical protein [Akkermansiaceae bacterium]